MLTAKDIPGENNFMSEKDGGLPEEVCGVLINIFVHAAS